MAIKIFNENWLLPALFFIGFFLRLYKIPQNLFFGPEQGIDFLVIKNIVVNHSLTLIGSKTDIGGIFHGPIYYYLSAIPFLLSQGNPLFVSIFYITISSLTVFLVYNLAKELFNKNIGLLAGVLFTFSFGAIIYSRWLSNPPLSILFAGFYFLFIYRFLKGHSLSLIFASISFCLLGQAEFLNFLFYGAITFLIVIIFRKEFVKQKISILIISLIILIIGSIGNYLLFDLRHDFLISNSLVKLMNGKSGYYLPYSTAIISNISGFNEVFASFVSPFNPKLSVLISILGIFLLFKYMKKYSKGVVLLLLWFIVPIVILIVFKHAFLEHFLVSSGLSIIILSAFVLDWMIRKTKIVGILLLFLIVGLNLYAWNVSIPDNKNIFFQSTQLDLKFVDQMRAIEEIYGRSEGKSFSFQSYTIPYWSQQGWEYLFWYYGKQKYGYEIMPAKSKKLFVIIQSDPSNKKFQEDWLNNTVSNWGTLRDRFQSGALEIRELEV